MSFFQQRKPKTFNYIPRSERDLDDGADDEKENKSERLKSQWSSVRGKGKHRKKSKSLPVLLVILGMIIAIWYLLTHYETI